MEAIDQYIHAALSPLGWSAEALIRLALAALLGGLVGLEREARGREAGFRTNILVCVGSALTMLVSTGMAEAPWAPRGQFNIQVDPARLAYGVMTGVGFLGAGAILKYQADIRGLTTAAGLWCVAAVGLATGFGFYSLAMTASLLVLAVLWGLARVDRLVPQRRFRNVTVRTPWEPGCVERVADEFPRHRVKVHGHSFRRSADLAAADVRLAVSFHDEADLRAALLEISARPGWELIAVDKA